MEKELSPQKNIKMVKVPTNGAGTFEGVNKMENNGSIVDRLLALNSESATEAAEAGKDSIVDKILALGESSATENFEEEHIGKPVEDKEEMYGFEAMDNTLLDEFRTAVSDSLTTVGSLTTLQKLMDSEDISSDFRDELYFIKNTYDLSDTNSVLEGIYNKAETLLEDMEIQTLTELLDSDIGDDEVIEEDELGEYQEPEDWSTIDQEPIEEGEAINPEEGTEENTEENNEEF